MTTRDEAVTKFLAEWTESERTGNREALERLLADDFVGIGPLGFMLPRDAWLARHATGDLQYRSFRLDDVELRLHGDAAIVTAHQSAETTYQGHQVPGEMRATLMLVRQRDDWRLAHLHMSFIAGTPGAPPIPGRP